MKKNKLMRIASVLLVATLLSTSVISGTFAKYVTTDAMKDEARVAKFGVVASIAGDLFSDSYQSALSAQSWELNKASVSSKTQNTDVVAPGTLGDKMTFTVKGTPEVSTHTIVGNYAENNTIGTYYTSDIYLKGGSDQKPNTFGIMVPTDAELIITTENYAGYYKKEGKTFTALTSPAVDTTYQAGKLWTLNDSVEMTGSVDYYPLQWTLTMTGTGANDVTAHTPNESGITALSGIKDDLISFFQNASGSSDSPNVKIDRFATLTWTWAYGNAASGSALNISASDKKDTILGDMMAHYLDNTLNGNEDTVNNEPVPQACVVLMNSALAAYTEVEYKTLPAGANAANEVVVAYTGTAPTALSGEGSNFGNICACLTVAFDLSITVEQVD